MKSVKILIVDDQPVFRQGLASLLGTISKEFEVVGDVAGMDDAITLYWIVRSVDGNKILEQIERTTMEVKECEVRVI